MRTDKHEAKKKDLIESAFRVWGKCRYRNTSLADLASAHGMTKQAIYRYFSSKEKLEQAMEETAMAEYRDAVETQLARLESCNAEDFAETYVSGTVQFLHHKGHLMGFLSYRYRRSEEGHPDTHRFMKRFADLAVKNAGIPEIGIRYLNSLTVMELHNNGDADWKAAWENGFTNGIPGRLPDFQRLLADASKLDFSAFGEDPLSRAVFETVMEEAGNDVSLGKVARKAGLTKSSLYNYWPSKEAMLTGVLARQMAVFTGLFEDFAMHYTDPADRLFAYLAFTGTFFRRTPEILNYMQRVMSFGVIMPRDDQTEIRYVEPIRAFAYEGLMNLHGFEPNIFLGLVNLAAVNEIKHHLTEKSARIRIDQCLKDLYLLIMGGIPALRRTM